MNTRKPVAISIIITLGVVMGSLGVVAAPGESGTVSPETADTPENKSYPDIAAAFHRDRGQSSQNSRLNQENSPTVTAIAEVRSGFKQAAREEIRKYGQVTGGFRTELEIRVPRSRLDELANHSSITYLRPPRELSLNEQSEGVSVINADAEHQRKFTGEGVTVAVIDFGFEPSHPEISDNVVDTWDYTGSGVASGLTTHGTATAEIVVDTAPNSSLILISVSNKLNLKQAVSDIQDHDEIDAVLVSLGAIGSGPLDGSDSVDEEITNSITHGTVWTISAGNSGSGGHWNGTWTDPDGNRWLNFQDDDEVNAVSGPVDIRLQWRDWPDSSEDYDLYLLNSSGSVVASSTNTQTGSQPPAERLTYGGSGTYYVAVYRYDASGTADFDLWSARSKNLQYYTNTRSITPPATARGALAVGAVEYSNQSLEPFSSRGPTVDGRVKPNLVAPDGVSTASYSGGFYGTSAAAPHVAGVGALITDANGTMSSDEIRARLTQSADPLQRRAPTNQTGYGLVNATVALPPQNPSSTSVDVPVINETTQSAVPVVVQWPASTKATNVTVRLSTQTAEVTTTETIDSGAGNKTVIVNATNLPDSNVTASAELRDDRGRTNPAGFTADSTPVSKDTTPAAVTEFSFDSPRPGEATLNFNVSEPITNASIVVDGPSTTKYALSNISSNNGQYRLTHNTTQRGYYEATVSNLTDEAGNTNRTPNDDTVLIPEGDYSVRSQNALNVTTGSATLRGNVTGLGYATDAETNLEFWEKGNKNSTVEWVNVGTRSSPGIFASKQTGLQSNSTYVVRPIIYNDSAGWAAGRSVTFTTDSQYAVATNQVTAQDAATVAATGELSGLGNASEVELNFEYWVKGQKDSTYDWASVTTRTSTGDYSDTLSGLQSNTTYVVRAVGYSDQTGWAAGQLVEVTTAGGYNVNTAPVTEVTDTTVTANGELTGLGGASEVESNFEYWVEGRKNSTYTFVNAGTRNSTGSYDATLSELDGNETYVVQAVVYNDENGWTTGEQSKFTTDAAYNVSSGSTTNVTASSATLNGELVGLGGADEIELNFEYWVKGKKDSTYSWISVTTETQPGTFSAQADSLNSNTTYVVRAVGYNDANGWTAGREVEFTTG